MEFDLNQFIVQNPYCAVWGVMPQSIKLWIYKDTRKQSPHPSNRRILATDVAHICRGPGRLDHPANILMLNRYTHTWCDRHGAAGLVLLMLAKVRRGEHDFRLWENLMAGCNSLIGWLQTDRVIQQCREWGLEPELSELTNIVEGECHTSPTKAGG